MTLLSDKENRMSEVKEVHFFSPNGNENIGAFHIKDIRGASNDIISFEEISDRTQAEKYKGFLLAIPREEAYELDEDEYFISDLIGMEVRDKEHGTFGTLLEIVEGSHQDIMRIRRKSKKDLYLPFQGGNVLDVDFNTGLIYVQLPDGLWEIYE